MAVCKKMFRIVQYGMVKIIVALGSMVAIAACGGDRSSESSELETPIFEGDSTAIGEKFSCSEGQDGDSVWVDADGETYRCQNGWWMIVSDDISVEDSVSKTGTSSMNEESSSSFVQDSVATKYITVLNKESLPTCDASAFKQRLFDKNDSVFFYCDSVKWVPENPNGYLVYDTSITGIALKGHFYSYGTRLKLSEFFLKNDSLVYSGRVYADDIVFEESAFLIPHVNMVYPYASLEIHGLWCNEVTGVFSDDTITLKALADLSKRNEVNINILTHLEYDRVVNLINCGYELSEAKEQAENEIMNVFGFPKTFAKAEELRLFVKDSSVLYEANAALLAITILFLENNKKLEINKLIENFKKDIANDGVWNDSIAKINMADWVSEYDVSKIRKNIEKWNVQGIPAYEKYLTKFWNEIYGLGECVKDGLFETNSNKLSKYKDELYICKDGAWRRSTDLEKDTRDWEKGEEGEVRVGNVNKDKYYVYENGAWRASANDVENKLGACVANRLGEYFSVGEEDYVCDGDNWISVFSEIGYSCDTSSRYTGSDNLKEFDLYFVCDENGKWRRAADEIENWLGACIVGREGNVMSVYGVYYTCKSKKWEIATPLEYDTQGWTAGLWEGYVRRGNVNTNRYYIYENGKWRESANEIENKLGGCVTNREGVVGKSGDVYYICKLNNWDIATPLEYDTYGLNDPSEGDIYQGCVNVDKLYIYENGQWKSLACSENGEIVSSKSGLGKKYVCDASKYRIAKEKEISLDKGCVSYTNGNAIRVQLVSLIPAKDSVYVCDNNQWFGSEEKHLVEYGSLIDERDGHVYKTVVIGNQTWMAENLRYADSVSYPGLLGRNWCVIDKKNSSATCGPSNDRFYTWSAAMDSVGTFSTKAKGCGMGSSCSPEYPVRGICPEGWHLPSKDEWEELINYAGGQDSAGILLKSDTIWSPEINTSGSIRSNAYGFSAIPSGRRSNLGNYCRDGNLDSQCQYVYYWSSSIEYWNSEIDKYRAYNVLLRATSSGAFIGYESIDYGYVVRCIKD